MHTMSRKSTKEYLLRMKEDYLGERARQSRGLRHKNQWCFPSFWLAKFPAIRDSHGDMKTTLRIFAFCAAAVFATTLLPASTLADGGNYTLSWGCNDDGQLDMPGDVLSNATQIAVGNFHSLALVNGRVYGWGASTDGALPVPSLQDIVFIAAGVNSGIAIRSDGARKFWGANTNYYFQERFCPTNGPYKSASLGQDHGLLLTRKGAVHAWGAPEHPDAVDIPNEQWKSGFSAVAAGRDFSLGLSNGCVHVAVPTNDPYHVLRDRPAAALSNVKAIAAGPFHAMALASNDEVLVWGAWTDDTEVDPIDDSFWSNAVPSKAVTHAPRGSLGYVTNVPPAARSNIVAISAGYDMCAAIDANGKVIIWGNGDPAATNAVSDYAIITNVPPYACQDIQEVALAKLHVLVRSSWLPPEFTGTSLPDANLDSPYSATIPFRADPSATISCKSGNLPPGIRLSPKGVLSGTPTDMGTNFVFKVVASNAYGMATREFSIVVKNRVVTAPVWQTASLPDATVGFNYSFQLSATNATGYTATQLPEWASLSSGGLLSGIPASTDIGNSYPIFTATNTAGSAVNSDLTLTVQGQSTNTPPVFGRDFLPDLVVGMTTNIDLQINGASGVSLSGDIASAFVVTNAGGIWMLSGTPTTNIQGSDKSAVITASNSAASATTTYSVNVFGPPVWDTTPIPVAFVGTNYSATVFAEGATGYTLAASAIQPIPLRLSFSNDSSHLFAILSGTPTNTVKPSQTFFLPFTATNAYGKASHTFTLTLSSAPAPVGDPGYRFTSISPSGSSLVLSWTVTNASAGTTARLVSTTNLFSWSTNGPLYAPPVTLTRPAVPTYYRLQAP